MKKRSGKLGVRNSDIGEVWSQASQRILTLRHYTKFGTASPLTHIFSLQQKATFSHQKNHTNAHFHGDRENLRPSRLLWKDEAVQGEIV
jgi:hypothetical protein